jgi:uncharacterized protein (PEP-CTERM system associated)
MLAAAPAVACADVSPTPYTPPAAFPGAFPGAYPGTYPVTAPSVSPAAGSTLPSPTPSTADATALQDTGKVRGPSTELSIDGALTATDNALSQPDDQKEGDLIAIVRPRMRWGHVSPGLTADLDAAMVLTGSMFGRQPDTGRPDVHASANATLVDQWLYFEAAGYAQQTEEDPFGPRVQYTSPANVRIEQQVAASPAIRHRFGPRLSMELQRSDSVTWNATGIDVTRYAHASDLRLDLDPAPLGASAALSRQDGHDEGVPLSELLIETAALGVKLAPGGSDLVLTAEGGRDHVRTALTDHTDPMAGVGLQWRPSDRTDVEGSLEQRFFGKGGTFTLNHRSPRSQLVVDLRREPVLASESFGSLSGQIGATGADMHTALDAILAPRYPDPRVRAGVVDQLLNGQGPNSTAFGPVDAVANYPQLLTQAMATWTWLAPRTTYSVAAWNRTVEVLKRQGDPLTTVPGFGGDNRQVGGTAQLSHRLTTTLSVDALAQLSRISGLGTQSSQRSIDQTLRVWLTKGLSARTTATAGMQVERFDSHVTGQSSFNTVLAFVGLVQRF